MNTRPLQVQIDAAYKECEKLRLLHMRTKSAYVRAVWRDAFSEYVYLRYLQASTADSRKRK